MILLIDNFDPHMREFYKYIIREYSDVTVIRNDELSAQDILYLNPNAIIIGSGIGTVNDTGICREVLKNLLDKLPVLGIGLGSEVLGECLGAAYEDNIVVGDNLLYNVGFDTSCSLFKGMSDIILCSTDIQRVMNIPTCPDNINIIAQDEYGRCLAFENRGKKAFGLCTYPVFLGEEGKNIICNFISIIEE